MTELHKFRKHLFVNILGTLVATLIFLSAEILGIWDIVEGNVFIKNDNGIIEIFIVVLGIIIPFLISIFILKWDRDQNLDFAIFLLTLIINVILIALYIFLPVIIYILILKLWISLLIMIFGIILLSISVFLSKKKKWGFGIFCLVLGNNILFLSLYCIIGRFITL